MLVTALGDVCLQHSGSVSWLNTGTGEVTQVAGSAAAFESLLDVEANVEWWLMPSLVERLRAESRVLQSGRCYTNGHLR